MAVDMFLELDGIKGDSVIKDGAIDVESWSFGMTQTGNAHTATGGGAGKVNVQDLHFMKKCDKSTPTLMIKCASGEHIKKGMLTCRKAGGKTPVDYWKLTFEDIIISSVQNTGSNGNDLVSESISFNFAQFKSEFTEQKEDGSKGATTEMKWNIAKNKTA
jgi:type VI secretion system secreted protein Hcp